MRKWSGMLFPVLVALLFMWHVGASDAQPMSGVPKLIRLAAATVTADATTSSISGLGAAKFGVCILNVTAISGAAPTLNIYIQSLPDGATVDDYVSFTQATTTGKTVATFNVTLAGAAQHAPKDGTLAAATNGVGQFGSMFQVKADTGGTFTSATYTVDCMVAG